ncbi:MAG: hypothetical protein ACR2LL_12730 [Nitrosopumilus sp.]
MAIIPFSTINWISLRKSSSEINPWDHHSALFFIQNEISSLVSPVVFWASGIEIIPSFSQDTKYEDKLNQSCLIGIGR